jgi:hypothetical protein
MSQEAAVLLAVKGVIYDLPPVHQAKVKTCAEQIRQAIAKAGDYGPLALALVGAEAAAAAL